MRLRNKILLGIGVFLLVLVGAFLILIGPWPVSYAGFEGTDYFNNAIAAIDANVKQCEITDKPGELKIGWGQANIVPPIGVPLAGLADRHSAASTGVHDELYVKAVAFNDGKDTAVLVGADMLLVPPNIAEPVRAEVAKQTPLTSNDIFFTASHSHDGPGGLSPGFVAEFSFGKYDPRVPDLLIKSFTKAIVDAYNSMAPAKVAHGKVDAKEYIRNRARDAAVDPDLNYMVIEKQDGKRCYVVRFSAHPTILGEENLQFTAEYPGFLQQAIEKATGGTAVYLGGALGSMSPRTQDAPDDFTRSQAYGETLAKLVLDKIQSENLNFVTSADVVSIGVPFKLPPFQLRPASPKWRLSPMLQKIAGLRNDGWMTSVRVGDMVFVNAPGDFSGEISIVWKEWAASKGYDMWTSGFSGEYAGYISPDKYYDTEKGKYETGVMSWTGPHQEAFFTALMKHMVEAMGKAPAAAVQAMRLGALPNAIPVF